MTVSTSVGSKAAGISTIILPSSESMDSETPRRPLFPNLYRVVGGNVSIFVKIHACVPCFHGAYKNLFAGAVRAKTVQLPKDWFSLAKVSLIILFPTRSALFQQLKLIRGVPVA
jgi:hypothetical protein